MESVFRIIDANINRVSEGLRVLEDISRFLFDNSELTDEIRIVRHEVRKNLKHEASSLINSRNSLEDVGLEISINNELDRKEELMELISANCKRVQEGLRSIEENLKIAGMYEVSKSYETCRYKSYELERKLNVLIFGKRKADCLNTDLYCLTSYEHSDGKDNIDVVNEMIRSGIKVIQYREKNRSMKVKYDECVAIRKITADAGVTFIVNDDVGIAIDTCADGIHIGQDDLPVDVVRSLVGDNMIIGLSTHSPEQAKNAVKSGADYIGVGPVYKTYTKKDVCDPVGYSYLEYVAGNIDIPFVAIGGIKESNVGEIINRGADCVAMVTEIVGADNIQSKIESIRNTMKKYKR